MPEAGGGPQKVIRKSWPEGARGTGCDGTPRVLTGEDPAWNIMMGSHRDSRPAPRLRSRWNYREKVPLASTTSKLC